VNTKTVVTLVELVGAMLYCWWLYTEIAKTENVTAQLWYYITLGCQRTALFFGELGMHAELEYHECVENGRM
jgi:hypothetical protein